MSKLQIISDKNKKSSKIKNLILKKIKSNQFKKENLIIVILFIFNMGPSARLELALPKGQGF